MNKKIIWGLIAVIIVIGLIVVGVRNKGDNDTIQIGAVIPLTGPGEFLGQQFQRGMILATEEINSGSDKLDIFYEDSQADPREAISAYRKIMTTKSPDLIVSAFSAASLALIPLVEEDEIPLMMGIVSASEYAKKSDYAFRYFTNADIEAPVMADYAVNQRGINRISVIYINDEYGNDYYNRFKERVEMNGGVIVHSETFLRADSDYRTQLLKIQNSDSEAVYIVGYDNHVVSILRQIQETKLDKVVMTNWIMASPNNIEQAGDSAEGILITTPRYYLTDSVEKTNFEEKFYEKFNNKPDAYAALGYDTVNILFDSLSKSGDILGNLKNINIQTLMGEVFADSDGEINFDLYPAEIRDGKLNPLQ